MKSNEATSVTWTFSGSGAAGSSYSIRKVSTGWQVYETAALADRPDRELRAYSSVPEAIAAAKEKADG